MREDDFDQTMEAWAGHEIGAAPEMRPTADMYRLLQAGHKEKRVSLASPRWALAGATIAGLLVLALLYVVFFQPPSPFEPPPGQQVALVGQREGFPAGKGVVVKGTVLPKRGEKGRPAFLTELMFQLQRRDAQYVEGIDLLAPQGETISVTSDDNYRLRLEPAGECHIYAFQRTSSGVLVQLFPNDTYSDVQNPLRQGETYFLPSEPNWFYLDADGGKERLYIIAAAQPLPELEDLYARYSQAQGRRDRSEMLASLLAKLESVETTFPGQAQGWVFVFRQE
jgi:hypothetical protein